MVVGVGITGVGQTTLEAAACIERADRVFYLVLEPTTERWIQQSNPNAVTLGDCYREGRNRKDTYAEMVKLGLRALVRDELASPGERVLVTAGIPIDVTGTTNLMKVEEVPE